MDLLVLVVVQVRDFNIRASVVQKRSHTKKSQYIMVNIFHKSEDVLEQTKSLIVGAKP